MLELIVVVVLILLNGLLAMSEMALVSSRRARLQQLVEDGDEGARAALRLAESPNRFLSTVQIGITLVGILAGAFGGATIASALADALRQIPEVAPYAESIAFTVVVVLTTYATLIFGELVPKRIALSQAERIASRIARPMGVLARITSPAVSFLSFSTDAVLRVLGVGKVQEPPVTEEEIRILLEQGARAGIFEAAEHEILEGVFEFGDLHVSELMTPRHEIVGVDVEDPIQESLVRLAESDHNYFPVYEGDLDSLLGVVSVRDIWQRSLSGRSVDFRDLLRQPLFVPESMPAPRVLEQFKQTGIHIALVTDEYGSIQGLVTLIDIMEAMVGEVTPPGSADRLRAVKRPDGSWLLDGMLSVDELQELLDVGEFPEDERRYYQTLGGFVMTRLRRIPAPADTVDWSGYRFEVVDMDGRRVDKVLATPLSTDERASESQSADQSNGA